MVRLIKGKLTLRICSRSSRKPSATEVIQNFLNLSFNLLSSSAAFGSLEFGRNDGIGAGGGVGDNDFLRGRSRGAAAGPLVVAPSAVGGL